MSRCHRQSQVDVGTVSLRISASFLSTINISSPSESFPPPFRAAVRSASRADFMDPLTLPRRAFHLALLAKTHHFYACNDLLREQRRCAETREREKERQQSIERRERGKRKKKIRETRTSYGVNSRCFPEITILTSLPCRCESSRVQNGPRVSRPSDRVNG